MYTIHIHIEREKQVRAERGPHRPAGLVRERAVASLRRDPGGFGLQTGARKRIATQHNRILHCAPTVSQRHPRFLTMVNMSMREFLPRELDTVRRPRITPRTAACPRARPFVRAPLCVFASISMIRVKLYDTPVCAPCPRKQAWFNLVGGAMRSSSGRHISY